MDVKECITGRRSIRSFKEDKVPHGLIEEIISEAAFAPSWKNTQITRYIAVEGALKDKIADECTSQYAHNGEIIKAAPMLVAVTMIKGRSGYERDGSFTTPKETGWQMFDAGVASQTFALAAHEHGIGCVIMGIFDEAPAAKLLNLPEDRELVCLIPVGFPNESPAAPKRKEVSELVSFVS